MYAAVPPPLPGDRLRRAAAFVLAAYLALYLADGLCSAADDLLAALSGAHRLAVLRNGVADACFWASWAVLFLTVLTPLLPKRFLYPPIAFVVLCDLVPPLFRAPLTPALGGVLDVVQLLVGAGAVLAVWDGLRPAPFSARIAGRRAFSWKNLLLGGFLLAAVLVPASIAWFTVALARQLEAMDGGFMLVHWNRLEMRAKTYVRADGKKIDLVPMIHIGEGSFYDQVAASFPPDTVVLTEGLTDRSRQAPRLDYSPVASALGLSSQSNEFRELPKKTQAEIRAADVDYADFSQGTRDLIALVAGFAAHPSLAAWIGIQREWIARLQADPGLQDRFFDEVLVCRNAHVLEETKAVLAGNGPSRIVLPWGALHMPGLERGVLAMGFQPTGTRSLDAIHYRTLLAGLKALRAAQAP